MTHLASISILRGLTRKPSAAVENLCAEVERRDIRALGTPLLGAVHGELVRDRALELLRPLFAAPLERVWIVTGAR